MSFTAPKRSTTLGDSHHSPLAVLSNARAWRKDFAAAAALMTICHAWPTAMRGQSRMTPTIDSVRVEAGTYVHWQAGGNGPAVVLLSGSGGMDWRQ